MRFIRNLALSATLIALCAGSASAEPTEILVRVISKGAKFVGSAVGGAEITLRDADTGELLSRGVTVGGTGSTPKIMTIPRDSRGVISDPEAAKFTTTLDLDRPRKITVTAVGPMSPDAAQVMASSTQWVVPGKHINAGDAWILELRGFSISLIEPPPAEIVLAGTSRRISLKAKVTMLCGCPTEPGGIWDADKFEVAMIVTKGGVSSASIPLSFAGEVSTFSGEIEIAEPGEYSVDLYAYDPANGNTGVNHFTLVAR